ncbi:MAG: ribonuclease J, partial [Candidatus Magasanikbacteria bacterium]|nr:ribonuclease J [Candidatus Magasanikbacteria bacterium]
PKFFIPIHGNRFMLAAHARLAASVGVVKENIFVADNGQVMAFDMNGGRLTEERVPAEHIMVDGLGVGDVSEIVLRDRMEMSADGMLVVIATMEESTGELIGNPDIISRGFIFMKDNVEIINKTRDLVRKILEASDHKSPVFDEFIKNKIRNDVGQFLFSQTKRRPMVLPVIIEV